MDWQWISFRGLIFLLSDYLDWGWKINDKLEIKWYLESMYTNASVST